MIGPIVVIAYWIFSIVLCVALDKAFFFHSKSIDILLFLNVNLCCGYSLEGLHRGTSNKYQQHRFFMEKYN